MSQAPGVTFQGSTYDERFVLADVDLDWQRQRDATHNWLHPDGTISIFPFPGSDHLWRIFAQISVLAGGQALYLIWPDGYVGFRSQPAREPQLLQYLQQIFTPGTA